MKGRQVALAVVSVACVLIPAGCLPGLKAEKTIRFDNAYFYGEDGKFIEERGKDACIALMRHHGYPVYKGMREELWVSDYGTGQFTSLGLGARMWKNNEEHRYMLMDIFLLPNQMLPEHWHLPGDKNPVKLEGWLVRYGRAHIVGEGEANLGKDVVIPKCHNGGKVTVEHGVVCGPGDFACLKRAEEHHWQLAGPKGAILTEVANVHTNSAVRHLDPAINKHFLGQ